MMMRPGDILGRIFFILSQKSIIGSSEFIHGAHGGHGFFFSCLKARCFGVAKTE